MMDVVSRSRNSACQLSSVEERELLAVGLAAMRLFVSIAARRRRGRLRVRGVGEEGKEKGGSGG